MPHKQATLNPRTIEVNPSLIHQLDGAVFALFGVRIEHDFMATSAIDAYGACFGQRQNMSMASALGLYLHDPEHMAGIVAAAITHRACGVFIVPVQQGLYPNIQRSASSPPVSAYALLHADSLLTVHLPPNGVRPGDDRRSRYVAILARFGDTPKFKNKVRVERKRKTLTLRSTPYRQRHLGPRPVLYHRVCQFADELSPQLCDDLAPASTPFPPQPSIPQPPQRARLWNVEKWTALTAD